MKAKHVVKETVVTIRFEQPVPHYKNDEASSCMMVTKVEVAITCGDDIEAGNVRAMVFGRVPQGRNPGLTVKRALDLSGADDDATQNDRDYVIAALAAAGVEIPDALQG